MAFMDDADRLLSVPKARRRACLDDILDAERTPRLSSSRYAAWSPRSYDSWPLPFDDGLATLRDLAYRQLRFDRRGLGATGLPDDVSLDRGRLTAALPEGTSRYIHLRAETTMPTRARALPVASLHAPAQSRDNAGATFGERRLDRDPPPGETSTDTDPGSAKPPTTAGASFVDDKHGKSRVAACRGPRFVSRRGRLRMGSSLFGRGCRISNEHG